MPWFSKLKKKKKVCATSTKRKVRLNLEQLEERDVPSSNFTGFLQGTAYVDSNNNGQIDNGDAVHSGALIKLEQKDGGGNFNPLTQTTTDANGNYRFTGLDEAATYRIIDATPNFLTTAASANSQLSAFTVTPQNAVEVTLVDTSSLQVQYVSRSSTAEQIHFTLGATPHYSIVTQRVISATGGGLGGTVTQFYSFCTNLTQDLNGPGDTWNGSAQPADSSLANNIPNNSGRVAYLYNHYGTSALSDIDAAALQVAMWELEYDADNVAPASLGSYSSLEDYYLHTGNFIYGSSDRDDAAILAKAKLYMQDSLGKNENAIYLRADSTISGGLQGMIATQRFDFLNSPVASIGDRVWVDTNGNGIQDSGENGLAGVKVQLFNSANVQVDADQTTDASGNYLFTGLTPGDYYVKVTLPSGYVFSPKDAGSNDAVDSDADTSTGVMATTTLTSGEDDRTWDAGVYQTATIGDRVWVDTNANGIQDNGENGLAGVKVQLFNSANVQVGADQTTDASGNYLFTGLTPGDYYVKVTLPSGYVFSPKDAGSNDAVDSDADTGTGVMATTSLSSGEDDRTWDAGVYQTATIGDRVWVDTNANGIQDSGENGLAGVTVQLYTSGNTLVGTQSTDANGLYLFTGLTPGDYYVKVTLPSGYVFSPKDVGSDDAVDSDADTGTGVMATTSLSSGEDDRTWDAGVYQTATIGDRVWVDTNANGIQDSGENGLAGVTVQLYTSGNTLVGTQSTDANGLYLFTGLTPGDYYVKVTLPSGYVFSPKDVGSDDAVDSDADTGTGVMATTSLSSGEDDRTWDAGVYQTATIGDRVWVDTNANGIQDSGENGLAGVTVQLYTSGNTLVGTQSTDANGLYLFTGLTPGDYYVKVTLPSGYVFSPKDVGSDDAVDSDADTGTGVMATTSLSSGEDDRTWDAGVYQTATIGDRVWVDTNANGIQDSGENGLAGVTVQLYTSGNTLVGTQSTDANGLYLFTGLTPGDYYVKVTLPSGYVFSPKDVGSDDAVDSDADTGTGVMATTSLSSGEDDRTWDAGVYQTATIGDRVWVDTNANGIQDSGENGLAGVTVQLYTSGNTLVGTQSTDANGLYLFTGLTPGDYYVKVTLPSGYVFSPKDVGSNDAVDSDANTSTGVMATTSLSSGEDDRTWDAGVYQTATIGDRVWVDTNANGIQDSGENGLAGVKVQLFTSANVQVGADQTTDASGNYLFTGLTPGDYYVKVTLPSGYNFSPKDVGSNDAVDSDANTSTGVMATTSLSSGEDDRTWDAGVYQTATIGDRVWVDTNANGIQDSGENGLAGVTVQLYTSGNTLVGTQSTDANGLYLFTGLTPGDYYVKVTLPSGYVFSPKDVGSNDAVDSDANTSTGVMATTSLSSGEDDRTWDAGVYQTATIGDRVWVDTNANGIQDSGENGLAGVKVQLFTSANVQVGADQTTDASGNYLFTGLTPGDYYVKVTLPSGYNFSPKDVGSNDAVDSDANTSTGVMATTTLTSGETDLTWDAGLYVSGKIAITKYVSEVTSTGGEGLTPGYWKQSQHFSDWVGYTQNQLYNTVFGLTSSQEDPTLTLLGALQRGGGGNNALGRHAVAALLNAANPNISYLYTASQIISKVQSAYATASYETTKNLFATQNELGADLTPGGGTSANGPLNDANTAPGLVVQTGSTVTFTYYVTNPGTVALSNVVVTDDNGTPGNTSDDFNPAPVLKAGGFNTGDTDSDNLLDPGETWKYSGGSVVVTDGQHTNIAVVTAVPVTGPPPVTASDPANWFGISDKDGTISGKKYLDVSGNGLNLTATANSPADTPLAGTTIYLDANNNGSKDTGELSTVTAADGSYSFSGLTPGTYYVREVVPTGYIRTGPVLTDSYTVNVTNGSNSIANNFANTETCDPNEVNTVSFKIYHADGTCSVVTNLSGQTREGDLITATFYVAGSGVHPVSFVSYNAPDAFYDANHASQQTIYDLATGTFAPGGPYTLTVSVPNNNYQVDLVCGLAINQLGPAGSNIFYTPQMRLESADNGGTHAPIANPGTISGVKYNDTNGNGAKGSGEQGLGNWVIYIDANNNGVRDANELATVTKADGSYKISNVAAGTYTGKVKEVSQTGWIRTSADQTVTVASGGSVANINLGDFYGSAIAQGDSATINFWKGTNGQKLIKCLNGGGTSGTATALGNWLASNFSNMYGSTAGTNNLTGKTNAQIAAYFVSLAGDSSKQLETQVLASVLSVYATNSGWAGGTYATSYGFKVTSTGLKYDFYNVGTNGSAFGVADNSSLTVWDILQKTNARASNGILWNGYSSTTKTMAKTVFTGINAAGGITS